MDLDCDFMSLSAHKIYGPKGVGQPYLREDDYGIPPISAFSTEENRKTAFGQEPCVSTI